jgi:membrane-bound serine protease (ClpP class)
MGSYPARSTSSIVNPGFLGRIMVVVGIVMAVLSSMLAADADAQISEDAADAQSSGSVLIIPIDGTIEPGLGHYLDRSIDEAEADGVSTIILDINTPGGRLDTVLEMRDRILDTDIPVVAFVNREAFSAGALITIASDEIWMTPGAVFGAATPIDGATGATASEKTISAVRATFRTTAEQQGRDPKIAEAMVDPKVNVEGLDDGTSLLSLSTDQALQYDYADGVADNRDDLLDELGFSGASVDVASLTFMEQATRWITDPVFASILILLGLALVVVDGLIGGFGIVALAGAGLLGLFFWGHLLADLAGWEDLVLIVVGVALIAIEAFVIPGFGVAGILGTLSLVGGLVLAMTSRSFGDQGFTAEAGDALQTLLITLALTVLVIVLFSWGLPRLVPSLARPARGIQRMTLSATVADGGSGPNKPGFLTRMLGGDDVVERDVEGHTALQGRRRATPHSPRDPVE